MEPLLFISLAEELVHNQLTPLAGDVESTGRVADVSSLHGDLRNKMKL